jgi:DNA-binding IclR family transcriptional regulator
LTSASGKLMLALADDDDREAVLAEQQFGPAQPHGYATAAAFRKELKQIAQTHLSINRPVDPHQFSLAMPLFNPDRRPIAALGLAMPAHAARPDADRLDVLISHLRQTTTDLQTQLLETELCPQPIPA